MKGSSNDVTTHVTSTSLPPFSPHRILYAYIRYLSPPSSNHSSPKKNNMPTILLLGGHGKVALHMTRLLTARGHKVHSVIRDASHVSEIASISPLAVPIVSSIEDATDASADRSMDGVQWVVWSAGAGGKGAKERTKAVDEDAAKRFIAAAIRAPGVSRFLMVSASVARREKAEWWDELDLEVGLT